MLDILLFAAGASRRMGGADKLLQVIDGQPLLVRSARMALATGCPVSVLVSPDRPARTGALEGRRLRLVSVADAASGMSASIKAGIAALPPDAVGAMFLMADMPDLRTSDLLTLIESFKAAGQTTAIRAAADDGTPGSPSIIPRRLFPALSALAGDQGGRSVLKSEDVVLVRLPGRRAICDLDTPQDWEDWRAARSGPED